jgi:uncharacterized protein (DUF3084 family)
VLISLGFLVLIVLMSAGIAVIADNVGRKLGKKRVSFKCRAFSMRPKHVAQLGTAGTGAAVSILTILVVALVSKDVRDWIVLGRGAIAQAEDLTRRARALEGQIGDREAKIKQQDSTIGAQKKDIEQKKREVEQGRTEVVSQKSEITKLTGSAERLRSEADRLRNDATRARNSFNEANRKLTERQAQLSTVTQNLTKVKDQLKNNKAMLTESMAQRNEFSKENIKLLAKNGELEKKQGELEAKQRGLQEDITTLEKARETLQAAHEKALQDLEETQDDLEVAQRELGQAQSDLRAMKQQLNSALIEGYKLTDITNNTRFAPLIYRVQEEVTRIQVDSGLSQASAEAAMNKLLRAARLEAIQRGARPNDLYPEAGIVMRRDPVTGEKISGEELQRRIVREIVSSGQPLVLVAYSSVNAFKGEPVSLDIVLYPNPVVYKNGQLVAEFRVDGRKDDNEIYRQVVSFVGPKLRERARQDRMIPRGSELAFGDVPGETLVKLVGEVKAAERPVRLIALAAGDTRAGDELKLAFQIR